MENQIEMLKTDYEFGIRLKKIKNLPDDFFENVLDLEMKLKRNFSMDTLQELVNLYSVSIEYYESIEDLKYKDYQNRLNILLTQPDILKKMNEYYMNRGRTGSDKKARNSHKQYKKDQEKKQIKMKLNYMSQITNFSDSIHKVAKIIETISNQERTEEKNVDSVLNEEINKQQDNFKVRLEERRRRQTHNISSVDLDKVAHSMRTKKYSAYISAVSAFKYNYKSSDDLNGGVYNENIEELNEIGGLTSSARTKKTDTEKSEEKTEINVNENIDIISETSFEKYEKVKLDEIDEMFSQPANFEKEVSNGGFPNFNINLNNSNGEKLKSSQDVTTTMFRITENLLDSKHIGPKHKQIFMEIRETLDSFVNEFNVYFYEHVFQIFTDHIHKLMDEKYLKYIEISKNYHSQIKEMEFLITGDCEDQHRDGIKAIIESLREEQEHELDRIEDYYNKLIAESQANFRNFGFKTNPGIQLIEEKFKLDMYNLINLILLPKK